MPSIPLQACSFVLNVPASWISSENQKKREGQKSQKAIICLVSMFFTPLVQRSMKPSQRKTANSFEAATAPVWNWRQRIIWKASLFAVSPQENFIFLTRLPQKLQRRPYCTTSRHTKPAWRWFLMFLRIPTKKSMKNYSDEIMVNGKDYFVITTNVDHCFQKAGFDKKRLFYTQGDYGLLQCNMFRWRYL